MRLRLLGYLREEREIGQKERGRRQNDREKGRRELGLKYIAKCHRYSPDVFVISHTHRLT